MPDDWDYNKAICNRKSIIAKHINEQLDRFNKYVEHEMSYIYSEKFDDDFYKFCLLCLDGLKLRKVMFERTEHLNKLKKIDVRISKMERVKRLYEQRVSALEHSIRDKARRWKFKIGILGVSSTNCSLEVTCPSDLVMEDYGSNEIVCPKLEFVFSEKRSAYEIVVGLGKRFRMSIIKEPELAFALKLDSEEVQKFLDDVRKREKAELKIRQGNKRLGKIKGPLFKNKVKKVEKDEMIFRELDI